MLSLITFVWSFNSSDVFGIGEFVTMQFGYDALSMRSTNSWYHYTGTTLSLGVILGVQGIVVAHELVTRTEDAFDLWLGRWVFALMFGTHFAVEHVHGYHKILGDPENDAVTPLRGSHFYQFLTKGAMMQWKHGWRIDKERLNAANKSEFSLSNRIAHAWIRGGLVLALVIIGGGWLCFAYYFMATCYAKFILVGLNFSSRYGLVRELDQPITPRLTFSSNNAWGNMILLNLARHGAYHTDNSRYQHLKAYPDSPMCLFGYLTMTVIAWIPPLFFKVMVPMLKEWDEKYATPGDKILAAKENAASGILELMSDTPDIQTTIT